jgi:hypothetical protein
MKLLRELSSWKCRVLLISIDVYVRGGCIYAGRGYTDIEFFMGIYIFFREGVYERMACLVAVQIVLIDFFNSWAW